MRVFALLLCFLVAVSAIQKIPLNVSNRDYTIEFDENKFSVLGISEKFCRDLASEFDLRTMEDLLLGCVSPVSREVRSQLAKLMDPSRIPQGELTPQSANWLASVQDAQKRAAAAQQPPPPPVSPAQLPTDFRVQVISGTQQFNILIDLNRFTLTSAAEQFCRQRREELNISSYEKLVDECIPQVSEIIRAELSKTYNPATIPVGELSADSKAGIANARAAAARQKEVQQPQQQQQQQAAKPAAERLEIRITANSNPYTIVADLNSFTLLTTAEAFCRQKAAELGLTTVEALVTRCIPTIANYIKDELAVQIPVERIPEGNLSPELEQWFRDYRTQQRAQVAAQAQAAAQATAQTALELNIPIDGVEYGVSFDIRQATPMAVAEALCSQDSLGLGLDAMVNICLPRVSQYVRDAVNRAIAPNTVALGEFSPRLRQIIQQATRA